MEHVWTDVFGEEVILTEEVKQVIFTKHPEVRRFFNRVEKVLAMPDTVQRSIIDVRVSLYYRFYPDIFNGKFIVVVVKRVDRKFISTLYITDKIKIGGILWPS